MERARRPRLRHPRLQAPAQGRRRELRRNPSRYHPHRRNLRRDHLLRHRPNAGNHLRLPHTGHEQLGPQRVVLRSDRGHDGPHRARRRYGPHRSQGLGQRRHGNRPLMDRARQRRGPPSPATPSNARPAPGPTPTCRLAYRPAQPATPTPASPPPRPTPTACGPSTPKRRGLVQRTRRNYGEPLPSRRHNGPHRNEERGQRRYGDRPGLD